jgi:hypothetical protein
VRSSWAHLNQLAEQWLKEEADQRMQGTVQEVVVERFAREAPTLQPLPLPRYDTAYRELRQVAWDGYIDVRGNRYSVPSRFAGQTVAVRIGLEGTLRVYAGDALVATHSLQAARAGWVTLADHHAQLWQETLRVEQRPLAVYEALMAEEVAPWS